MYVTSSGTVHNLNKNLKEFLGLLSKIGGIEIDDKNGYYIAKEETETEVELEMHPPRQTKNESGWGYNIENSKLESYYENSKTSHIEYMYKRTIKDIDENEINKYEFVEDYVEDYDYYDEEDDFVDETDGNDTNEDADSEEFTDNDIF